MVVFLACTHPQRLQRDGLWRSSTAKNIVNHFHSLCNLILYHRVKKMTLYGNTPFSWRAPQNMVRQISQGKPCFSRDPVKQGKKNWFSCSHLETKCQSRLKGKRDSMGRRTNDLGTSFYGSTPYVGGCAVRAHDSRPVSRQFRFLDDERFFLERFNRTTCLTLDWLYHRQLLLMLMMHLVNQWINKIPPTHPFKLIDHYHLTWVLLLTRELFAVYETTEHQLTNVA
jgi:hypothetical protein